MTNWYIVPGGAGSKTGANWANAWDMSGISWGSIGSGDTVWLAGGTYLTQLIPTASGTLGNPINIYRVRSTDTVPVAAVGWNASFDSQVIFASANWPQIFIQGPLSYVNIDGRIMSGILLQGPAAGGDNFRVGVSGGGNVDHLFVSHLEIFSSASTSGLSQGRYSFNLVPGEYSAATLSNSTIDHCIVHQTNEAFRANGWNNVVIQYCQIHDTTLDNIDHNDLCYSSGSIINVIWRYNTFWNSPSDGLLFESNTNITGFQFYGNVVYNCALSILQTKAGTGTQQLDFYNNVFAGIDAGANSAFVSLLGASGNCHFYDNIFYNCQLQYGSGVTPGYNAYYPSLVNGNGWPSSEPNSFLLSAQPFNNPAGGDFTITPAALAANPKLGTGIALATDGFINYDMNGVQRIDGSWTVGAFQAASVAAPVQPVPIDRTVDQAIASLLATVPGLVVVVGAEDNYPVLQTPYLVVYSQIQGFSGRVPIYRLLTTIEYQTISGQDMVTDVETVMGQIDVLIGPGGDHSSMPGVNAAGLRYLGWESIDRGLQDVGDRRKNIRELLLHATI
jgi:hypothetical protein